MYHAVMFQNILKLKVDKVGEKEEEERCIVMAGMSSIDRD